MQQLLTEADRECKREKVGRTEIQEKQMPCIMLTRSRMLF